MAQGIALAMRAHWSKPLVALLPRSALADEHMHGCEQHPPQEGAVSPNMIPELGIVIRFEGHSRSRSPNRQQKP
jgi:hypothetical protein